MKGGRISCIWYICSWVSLRPKVGPRFSPKNRFFLVAKIIGGDLGRYPIIQLQYCFREKYIVSVILQSNCRNDGTSIRIYYFGAHTRRITHGPIAWTTFSKIFRLDIFFRPYNWKGGSNQFFICISRFKVCFSWGFKLMVLHSRLQYFSVKGHSGTCVLGFWWKVLTNL